MPPRPEMMSTMDDDANDNDSFSFAAATATPKNEASATTTKKKKKQSRNKSKERTRRSNSNNHPTGMTVSQFHKGQQGMQDAAVARSKSEMARMHRQQSPSQQQQRRNSVNSNSTNGNPHNAAAAAVVPAAAPTNLEKVVDVVPSDHPAATYDNHSPHNSIFPTPQTYRTCHLCHRSLPRSKFSERDSSLSPTYIHGMTCRTCTMTLCAARLSPNPTNMQQLLLQYAMRSHEMGSEILLAALQSAAISGEEGVENNELVKRMMGVNGMNESEMSMILRERSINSSSYFTNELELRNGSSSSILNNGHFLNEEGNRRPSSVADCKYIDTLLSMPCYLNINALGVFGSSAEVSGSLAALEAVRLYGTVGGGGDEGGEGDEEGGDGGYHRYFVPHDCDGRPVLSGEDSRSKSGNSCGSGFGNNIIDPRSIVCLVLGEGRTPRTAILASQHYCWTTIAIDPTLSEEWDGYHDDAPNFVGYGGSLAEFMDDYDDGTGMIVGRRRNSDLAESMNSTMREYPPRHLVIIAIQPLHSSPAVRLRDNGHINELRARYGDVPTTLVSLRPIPETNWFSPSARMEDGTVGPRRSKLEEDMGYEPNFSYVDEGIFSECRQVEVWNFHNADDDDDDYYSDEEAYEDGEDGVAEAAGEEKEAMEEERLGSIDTENEEAHTRNASKKKIGEEQVQQRGKSDHHHHVPPAKQSPKKKNEWLEARVAEYKNQQRKAKKYNEEHNESFNTLSTKGTVDTRRVSEVLENPHDIANQCRGHDELDNSSVWSPQDEDALNRVWDKAMSVYDEQQSQSSHQQQDNDIAKRNPHENLPAGWNAFVDPASGDYYYANSETGESTWDLPSCSPNDVVVSCQDEHDRDDASMASKMSELTSEDQPNAAAANNKGADTPPSMQYKPKQNPRLSTILDNDSQSHLDDQSSVSSGIAALNRWNMSDTNLSSHSNDTPDSQERRGSPSLKQQPWHKKDDDEMGNGDSFMFDDYY